MKKLQFLLPVLMLAVAFASCSKSEKEVDEPKKSSEKSILSVVINGQTGLFTESDNTIIVTLPEGVDITSLAPEIEIPENATISPSLGIPQDFSQPVTYTVTAEDGTVTAFTIVVVLNNACLPKPVIAASSGSVCGGGSVELVISNASSFGAEITFSWYNAQSGLIMATNQPVLNVTAPDAYWVVAKNGDCSSLASDRITVAGMASGTKAEVFASSTVIPAGGSVILTATVIAEGASYTWYKDGVLVSTTVEPTFVVTASGTYHVVTSVGGCSSIASDPVSITLASQAQTKPSISQNIVGCGTVTLQVDNPSVEATYLWYKNGVSTSQTGVSYVANQAGSYSVEAAYSALVVVESDEVSIASLPTLEKPVITPSSPEICQGGSVTIMVSGSLPAGVTCRWFKNGELLVGTQTPSIVITEAGTYTVIVSNGECQSQASDSVEVTLCNG